VLLNYCGVDKSQETIIKIDLESNIKNTKNISISKLNAELTYVPLESESITINTITKCDINNDLVLVSDNNRQCFLFDREGKLLTKVGQKGKGPGEYITISSVNIGFDGKIYIHSMAEIYVYALEGEFIRKFKPEVNNEQVKMSCWKQVNDTTLLGVIGNISGIEQNKAVLFGFDGKTIKYIPNYILINKKDNTTTSLESMASIYKYGNKIYYKEVMNDTLFNLADNLIFKPRLFLHLGKYKQPISKRELPLLEMIKTIDDYIFIYNIFEINDFIFLDCDFGKNSPAKMPFPVMIEETNSYREYYTQKILGVYNKSTSDIYFAKPKKEDNKLINTGLINDFDSGVNFYPQVMVNDSILAMWVHAYMIKEHVASDYFKNSTPQHPEKKQELQELADRLSIDDNPVLILMTFKNDTKDKEIKH